MASAELSHFAEMLFLIRNVQCLKPVGRSSSKQGGAEQGDSKRAPGHGGQDTVGKISAEIISISGYGQCFCQKSRLRLTEQ